MNKYSLMIAYSDCPLQKQNKHGFMAMDETICLWCLNAAVELEPDYYELRQLQKTLTYDKDFDTLINEE